MTPEELLLKAADWFEEDSSRWIQGRHSSEGTDLLHEGTHRHCLVGVLDHANGSCLSWGQRLPAADRLRRVIGQGISSWNDRRDRTVYDVIDALRLAAKPEYAVSWRDFASCKGVDYTVFFPEPGSGHHLDIAAAKLYCNGCPVRSDCLEHAVVNGEQGVWAGTTDDERERLRRKRGLQRSRYYPLRQRVALHGSRSRYVAGCHCDECRRAEREYQAARSWTA